jgi:hypothetical protein
LLHPSRQSTPRKALFQQFSFEGDKVSWQTTNYKNSEDVLQRRRCCRFQAVKMIALVSSYVTGIVLDVNGGLHIY